MVLWTPIQACGEGKLESATTSHHSPCFSAGTSHRAAIFKLFPCPVQEDLSSLDKDVLDHHQGHLLVLRFEGQRLDIYHRLWGKGTEDGTQGFTCNVNDSFKCCPN